MYAQDLMESFHAHGDVDVQGTGRHAQGEAHRDHQRHRPHLRKNSWADPQILQDRARRSLPRRDLFVGQQGCRRRVLHAGVGGDGGQALGLAAAASGMGNADGGRERGAAARRGGIALSMITGAATVLTVRDIAASTEYYRDALGFAVAFEYGEPTFYAGLCRDEVELHLIAANQTKRQPGHGAITIFVEDVDALHAELVAR